MQEKAAKVAEEAGLDMDSEVPIVNEIPAAGTGGKDEGNDDDSAATPVAGTSSGSSTPSQRTTSKTAPNFRSNVAFFNARFVVPPSRRPIDEAVKKCQLMLKILQDADKTVILTPAKG